MALPQYTYGKVTGLYPDLTVVSERSESPMVCCGYCSTHMACITAKAGLSDLMHNEAHMIRARGGRAHNAGSKPSELRAGALAAVGVTLRSLSVNDIPVRLKAGFAVVVSLQYGQLPAYLKVQSNDFGHSATLFGWDEASKRVGFFDPLWDQDARGAWSPWTSIKAALWGDGQHSSTIVKRVPSGGGATDMSIAVQTEGYVVEVPSGGVWWLDSARTQKGASFGPTDATYVGWVEGPDSRAIEITTAVPYPDGKPKKTIVYVSGSYAIRQLPPKPTPVPPTDDTQYDEADLLAAKQEGYDLALGVFPPRPE